MHRDNSFAERSGYARIFRYSLSCEISGMEVTICCVIQNSLSSGDDTCGPFPVQVVRLKQNKLCLILYEPTTLISYKS
jgi:hypothetical protein